ncbi:MAG TPA: CehA/McbA family metallohydrolase [Thermomicrobiales bacterium]|nr:CehA/McbA family metallohydrolase [Thermomicrobiales bacterium]
MRPIPFDRPGRFFRGNLHTHSTCSDGDRTVEQVVGDYRDRGYDFVCISDHFLPKNGNPATVTDARACDTDDFVTIPGAEIHGPGMENGEWWHIVANGLPLDFAPPAKGESGLDIARRAVGAGAFVSLAHPFWNSVTDTDAVAAAGIVHSVEIYNHNCEAEVARGDGLHQAEILLGKGHRLTLNAADDAHFHHPSGTFADAFGGWVMVRASELTASAIVAALKEGAFYASQGPEIHDIEITDGEIRVSCSPVDHILFTGKGSTGRFFHEPSMIGASAPLPDPARSPYIRVTVTDSAGRSAWSNPIWLG